MISASTCPGCGSTILGSGECPTCTPKPKRGPPFRADARRGRLQLRWSEEEEADLQRRADEAYPDLPKPKRVPTLARSLLWPTG